jgi:hypothetical protein
MRNSRRFSHTAVVVMLAGAVLVPAAALARGGGFAHGGHGPVFGLHRAPVVTHRPFRPVFAPRFPGRFAHAWRLHRFGHRRDGNGNGIADAGYAGGYYPGSAYAPGDVTGTIAPDTAWRLPAAPSADHVGCSSRGYEVPGESGGVARVTVTRC